MDCERGKWGDAIGAADCNLCREGQYGDLFGATSPSDCSDCLVGRYGAGGEGATSPTTCLPCQRGKSQNTPGSTACNECVGGSFSENEGSENCDTCLSGKWMDVVASVSRYDCLPCYDTAVKSSFTSSSPAGSKESCTCRSGEVFVGFEGGEEDTNELIGECRPCGEISQDGTNCDEEGVSIEFMKIMDGFWRSSNSSTDVRECPLAEACVGGGCLEGHTGPYCKVCEDGFGAGVDGICVRCEETGGATSVVMSVLLLVAGVGVVGFYKLRVKKAIEKKWKFEKNCVKAVLRILFVSFQVLSILPTVVPEMGLPEVYEDSVGTSLGLFQMDLFEVVPVGCLSGGANYFHQVLVVTIVPLAICGACWVVGKVRGASYTGVVVLVLFAVLPTVTTTIFGSFRCESFDTGSSFLVKDYTIDCAGGQYATYTMYSIVMIVVYPVGVPIYFAWLLYNKRELIKGRNYGGGGGGE